MLRRVVAVVLAAVSLAACATVRPHVAAVARAPAAPEFTYRAPLPTPQPLYIPPPYRGSETFTNLPGWADDDHAGAFAAFLAGCRAARDPALAETCREAVAQGPLGETDARQFFETHFRPERLAGPVSSPPTSPRSTRPGASAKASSPNPCARAPATCRDPPPPGAPVPTPIVPRSIVGPPPTPWPGCGRKTCCSCRSRARASSPSPKASDRGRCSTGPMARRSWASPRP